jgi:glutathione S-transferase
MARLQRPLAVVDGHLGQHGHLVGQRFTMADLNVASVIGWLAAADRDLAAYPDLSTWLAECAGRPAAKKCTAMAAGL